MGTLSDQPLRSSLDVAPLFTHQCHQRANAADTNAFPGTNPYSSDSRMTPPATPNGSQEDLLADPDSPVFHNFLRAAYAFEPDPNISDQETVQLPIIEGDVIMIHSVHTNGWADGTMLATGARGWIPTNYCAAYEPDEMRSLLPAVLNFWDFVQFSPMNDGEIFGSQELIRGIIAGVRYLLERTHCLTRESPIISRHDGLRKSRKRLLSELSNLVKTSKLMQETHSTADGAMDIHDIMDEMLLRALKIGTRAVHFLDDLEEDRMARAPAVSVMATVLEEVYIPPPSPPADSVSVEASRSASRYAGARQTGDAAACYTNPYRASEVSQATALPGVRCSSACVTASTSTRRLSQGSSLQGNRPSSTLSHRVSLTGATRPRLQNLVSERLNLRHDIFLTHFASLIGRLHLQSQSRPHLAIAIKQSASSGGDLLVVIDVVCARSPFGSESLGQYRAAMYDRIRDLVYAARDIIGSVEDDIEEVLLPHDSSRLLGAATGCVIATGECVHKTKSVIERIGDFEFGFDEETFDVDLDLACLDRMPRGMDRMASESASIAESSLSDAPTPSTPSTISLLPAAQQTLVPVVDKPLPQVPQDASAVDEERPETPCSAPASRVQFSVDTTHQTLHIPSSSVSLLRPALPPLPKISTSYAPQPDYSPLEPCSGHDMEFHPFGSESMAASSSGSSTCHSRDSESTVVSQASTRATTPDLTHVPRNQPSLSDLSTAGSSTMGEEVEEVESKLLEKTFAHELVFNKEGVVTGGSLPALVERLTVHETTPDAMFVSTFYLTFRLFCSPRELAQALIDRFDYVGESPRIANAVRLRVYNVFKGWLESHWRDDMDCEATALIQSFAESKLGAVLPSAGKRLLDLAQKVSSCDGNLVPRLVSSMGKTNTSITQYIPIDTPLPAPVLTKSAAYALNNWRMGGTCPVILDFDPTEIARQLTIRQMTIFCAIMPEELLGSQWMKKGGLYSPNVKAMSSFSTDLSNLVADTILHYGEVKKRAAVIKHWIKIAGQCLELNNYDALMAIICSLNSSTITRLRKTWDVISPKRRESLKQLQAIVEPSQNNKVLRTRLQGHVPPCLPFLGMFLTDLTFIDIGNPPTRTNDAGLSVVNFDKHTRTAKIIGDLQRFQIPYRLTELPDMQEWIQRQVSRVRELEAPGSNVQVSYYRKSLLLEPRETQNLRTLVEAPANSSSIGGSMFGWMRGNSSAAVPTQT